MDLKKELKRLVGIVQEVRKANDHPWRVEDIAEEMDMERTSFSRLMGPRGSVSKSHIKFFRCVFAKELEIDLGSPLIEGENEKYKTLYEDLQRAVDEYFNSRDALQKLSGFQDRPPGNTQNSLDAGEGTTAFAPLRKKDGKDNS